MRHTSTKSKRKTTSSTELVGGLQSAASRQLRSKSPPIALAVRHYPRTWCGAFYWMAQREGKTQNAILRYQGEILPGKAPKTQQERGYQLRRLNAVFGHMRLEDVKPPHIQQYLEQREKRVAANREIRLLSTIYRHAKICGTLACRSRSTKP